MPAFFISLAGGAWGLAKRGFALLSKLNGWQLLCITLFAASAIFYVQRNSARDDLDTARVNLNECREARKLDHKAYEEAQRKAAELNQAEVSRITTEQDRISDNVEADLNARLERLRSELRKGTPAPQGHSGGPEAGPNVPGSPGTLKEAGVCISSDQFLLGAEYEEKLDQWITLYWQQHGVAR